MLRATTFTICTQSLAIHSMPQTLSPTSIALLANWKRTDKRFFRKYRKDERTMEIVAALAEMIANYETRLQKPTLFYC